MRKQAMPSEQLRVITGIAIIFYFISSAVWIKHGVITDLNELLRLNLLFFGLLAITVNYFWTKQDKPQQLIRKLIILAENEGRNIVSCDWLPNNRLVEKIWPGAVLTTQDPYKDLPTLSSYQIHRHRSYVSKQKPVGYYTLILSWFDQEPEKWITETW